MRKIENFAQISDLLNAQLKKGVITNNFLRGEDYCARAGRVVWRMANAAAQFCALGFREVLRRTRRTRKPESFPVETTAVPAKPEDFEDISRFLSEHFSALTGCLPTADDLR